MFLEINQSETRMACGGHVCERIGTRNEQSLQRTFHRCFIPTFGSFGQGVSEEKIFLNRPIRNKNCLWRPCLLIDWNKMSNLYKGPSIDASYQVSVHLGEGFQRIRLKCEKLTDNRRRMPSDGRSSHCLWQSELKRGEGQVRATSACAPENELVIP